MMGALLGSLIFSMKVYEIVNFFVFFVFCYKKGNDGCGVCFFANECGGMHKMFISNPYACI